MVVIVGFVLREIVLLWVLSVFRLTVEMRILENACWTIYGIVVYYGLVALHICVVTG